MDQMGIKRRLTCILAADAVGYSKLMGADETGTVRILAAHRAVIDGIIAFHEGRIIGTAGDSVLAEFPSAVEAVRCAVEIQEALKTRNESLPEDHRLYFRVGVNLGDVVVKGDDLLGDGVNVAARLEGLAEPGGVCISSSVYDQITGKLDLGFLDIGEQQLKHISRPIRVYRVSGAHAPTALRRATRREVWRSPVRLVAAGAGVAVLAALALAWQGRWLGGTVPPLGGGSPPGADGARRSAAVLPEATTPPAEPPRPQVDAAADEARRRAVAEAEVARTRAEAEAAAIRARAEAAATRTKAEAEAVRVRAEAEALAARTEAEVASRRAQSEVARIRGAAEADRAKAEQALRAAEAKAAAPATRLPAAAGRANPYDGDWVVTRACAAYRNLLAGSARWGFTVRDGEFVVERGLPGEPGYNRVSGRPTADGALVLTGMGISGAQGNVGKRHGARFEGRLDGDRGVLQGKYGRRDCTLALARARAEQAPRAAEAKAAVLPPAAVGGANPYDGDWVVTRACEAYRNLPPRFDRWTFTVRDGEFVLERGVPGEPFYSLVSGRPGADGGLVLTGMGISGAEGAVGRQYVARFEGRLDGDRGVLQGKYGGRDCALTLARAGG